MTTAQVRVGDKHKIHLVFCGDRGHGKSTLIGRLLYERGRVPQDVIAEYKELSAKIGHKGSHYAWILDKTPEERTKGFTQDIQFRDLETDEYIIWAIDTPGHADFIDRLIAGLSEADAGVLVVAADDGITPQTEEHAVLARILGISQLIVALSKMDLVGYNRDRFKSLERSTNSLLLEIGFTEDKLTFIPLAPLLGENVSEKSSKMSWYVGPTFTEALDLLVPPEKLIIAPFRMPIDTIYSKKGVGTILCGKIITGEIRKGETVIIEPGGVVGRVKSIEEVYQERPGFEAGDNVGMVVEGLDRKDVKEGYVVGKVGSPPRVTRRFVALITILHHPARIYRKDTLSMYLHATRIPVFIEEIRTKVDPRSREVVQRKPAFLRAGETGIVVLNARRPIVVETQDEVSKLSRFVLRDIYRTMAAGICLEDLGES
jgi:elongation factor 1-alpha